MNSMVIWIVIGGLIVLIAGFLVFMSIKDRRNVKKEKVAAKELEIKKESSGDEVIIFLNELLKTNDRKLKNFKPSIGKIKMNDIKVSAKKNLISFSKTEDFILASGSEKNKDIITLFENLQETNCNLWNKKFSKDITSIKDKVKIIEKEKKKTSIAKAKEIIKGDK